MQRSQRGNCGSTNLGIGFDDHERESVPFLPMQDGNEASSRVAEFLTGGIRCSRGHVAQKAEALFLARLPRPSPLRGPARSTTAPIRSRWTLARGAANELRQRVARKHVAIPYAIP